MGNLFYVVALMFVAIWAVGFIGFHAGGYIHLLLVLAVIAVSFRLCSAELAKSR